MIGDTQLINVGSARMTFNDFWYKQRNYSCCLMFVSVRDINILIKRISITNRERLSTREMRKLRIDVEYAVLTNHIDISRLS